MTRRRWIATLLDDQTAHTTGAQAAHLAHVLRAQPGMNIDVAASGRVFHAEVASVTPDEVRFSLLEEINSEPALPVTLLLAIYKFDRMEWAIEKATELGVERIIPVLARRTEKHLAQSAEKRVERWRRIAHEAAKQSRRSDIPAIEDPAQLAAMLHRPTVNILLSENEREHPLRATIDAAMEQSGNDLPQFTIAIGPEGGWTDDETTLFAKHDWQPVTLGPRILRAETAAISALSITASCLL